MIDLTKWGEVIDTIPGAEVRTPQSVAGRLLEEVVELCLVAGLNTGEIYQHVTDAVSNQYSKLSYVRGKTIFPSEAQEPFTFGMVSDEIADVQLMLYDFAHVTHFAEIINTLAFTKAEKFKTYIDAGEIVANSKGNVYRKKPHVIK